MAAQLQDFRLQIGAGDRWQGSRREFRPRAANIPLIDVLPAQGANVYDILRRETLVLTQDAVTALTERLKAKE